MSTPANTPPIATINGQGDAPVEDQHFKRWMLTMAEAFVSGGAGGLMQLVAGSAIIGKVGIDQTTPGTTNGVQINAALPAGTNAIGSTKDGGTAFTTSLGVTGACITSADQSAAVASITDAPTSGQKIVIDDILFSSDTALRLDFSEETSGTILFSVYTSAGSSGQFTPRGKLKLATADKKLQWRASAAGNIAVTPLYHSEA